MLVCLVIIDPVQQGDAQLSHPLFQVSAVPELLCSVVGWQYCVVMYLMVYLFDLNHAGTTTVHIRLGTSSVLPDHLHIWGVVFPVQVFLMLMGKKCSATDVLSHFTIIIFSIISGPIIEVIVKEA